jgi:hypothetical protein
MVLCAVRRFAILYTLAGVKGQDVRICSILCVIEVYVPHLASHILSQCIKRLYSDWLQRYAQCWARDLDKPGKSKKRKGLPIEIAVYACEIDYPSELKEPLEWMLLTTVEVSNFDDAEQRLK